VLDVCCPLRSSERHVVDSEARNGHAVVMRSMAAATRVVVKARTMMTSRTSSGASKRLSHYRGQCFDCGQHGHMIRNCLWKKKEWALLCDVDEDEVLV
jgi:hypothetical protein